MSEISDALDEIVRRRALTPTVDKPRRVPVAQTDSKAIVHAKTMLEAHLEAYQSLPAKVQAAAIEYKRAVARITSNRELSDEGRTKQLTAVKQKRDQQTTALRKELGEAKEGVDQQLAVLRRGGNEDTSDNAKLLGEMQLSRAWSRIRPRLQRAASDKRQTAFTAAINVIKEAKAAGDRVTLNALREEIPAFIDNHEPAGDRRSREQILSAITGQIDAAESELSPEFDLARRFGAETVRGYGVIHQSLNTLEGEQSDPSSIRIFDWPDQDGKVAQLAVE